VADRSHYCKAARKLWKRTRLEAASPNSNSAQEPVVSKEVEVANRTSEPNDVGSAIDLSQKLERPMI
jgi:hypothetical protein